MAGAPAKYETAEELQAKIEEYFVYVKGERGIVKSKLPDMPDYEDWIRFPEPVTITGLALFLGFGSRQSIYDYAEKGEFSYIIKNAQLRVENQYEINLHSDKCTGSIFALKNMGWRDKVETGFTDNEGKDREITGMVIT